MITRYDAAYLVSAAVMGPYLAWRWARRRKYRRSASGMLGRELPVGEAARIFSEGSVWMHAVSVGEVAAASAIAPGLRSLIPELPLVVSTITETGQDAARRSLPGADAHTFFPVDFSWTVRRFLEAYRPKVFVLLEAELWPNFLTMASRSGTRIYLVNGRMSDRSFPRYRRMKGLLRPVFDAIEGFCVQTETDAERFAALGIEAERIRVTGNVKFDLKVERLTERQRVEGRAALGIAAGRPVVVAGSTHEGEEELLLGAFREVIAKIPDACMVLAPRHPERFGAVAELARKQGFRVALASATTGIDEVSPPQVVILDKMGVLAQAYGLGDVAIVAGSFCPTGGHNLLEAAAHTVPVIYGPDMHSQRELARLFAEAGAGTQIQPDQLSATMTELLVAAGLRVAEGRKAFGVVTANQGSAARAVDAIRSWMSAP